MKLKQHNNISEKQVEDALVTNLFYLQKILDFDNDLKLLSRQLRLKSGEERIDLLLSSGKNLCLIEIKVKKYEDNFIKQINDYKNELINMQHRGELINSDILSFLLITGANKKQIEFAKQNNVVLIIYEPLEVLKTYYEDLSVIAPFLKIKPNDYGVFSLGLINRVLIQVSMGITNQKDIAIKTKLSNGSVHNHLRVAKEFGLIRKRNNNYFLTDIGDTYVQNCNESPFIDRLSPKQIEILKRFVAEDPFYSSNVFGIYSLVESAFLLSRNFYPIPLNDLKKMFQIVSGKITEWQVDKSLSTATYTFLNFAIDLELIGKIGKHIVITPAGFHFILMLQLHKSIEMIESLSNKN